MAKSTIAQPGQEPQTRIDRGRKLYAEHAEQIWFDRRLRCWIVPSQHDGTSVYEVRLGREEECECKDFEYRSPASGCIHIIAATLCKAKTFACCGCGDRFPNRELVEVGGDNLTFFEILSASSAASTTAFCRSEATFGGGGALKPAPALADIRGEREKGED